LFHTIQYRLICHTVLIQLDRCLLGKESGLATEDLQH